MNDWKYFARWVAFLPGAILASFFALATTRLWLLFIMSDSMFRAVVAEAFPGFACGLAFIEAGYFIAPSHKKIVSFSLFAVLLLFIGFGLAASLIVGQQEWQKFVAITGVLIGAGSSTWRTVAHIESRELTERSGT